MSEIIYLAGGKARIQPHVAFFRTATAILLRKAELEPEHLARDLKL